MRYQLVQMVDGEWVQSSGHIDNVIPAFEVRGFKFTGFNVNKHHRVELQGQPKFAGLAGPMYGGPGVVRYETWPAYNVMST